MGMPARLEIGGEGIMGGRFPVSRPINRGSWCVERAVFAGALVIFALVLLAAPAAGEEPADSTAPLNAVSSTGGVATATGSSSVTTGDIVTGYNTGHTVETGGTSNGDLTVTVDAMSSAADLEVVAEIGPQIADASGGDNGKSTTTPGAHPEYNVNIDNTDKNKNDNRSNATGIGNGGEGGTGGSGGTVVVGEEPVE
jgi:hypothetical protein